VSKAGLISTALLHREDATPVPPIASLRASVHVPAAFALFAINKKAALIATKDLFFIIYYPPSYFRLMNQPLSVENQQE